MIIHYVKVYPVGKGCDRQMQNENEIILSLHESGMDSKEIGILFGISADAVDCRNYRTRQIRSLPPKEVTRKTVINGHWGIKIKDSVGEDSFMSTRDRCGWLSPPFCRRTMMNFMNLCGLYSFNREVRIVFTDRHRAARVQFAHDMLQRMEDDPFFLSSIIWSDEVFVRLKEFNAQKVYYSKEKRPDCYI